VIHLKYKCKVNFVKLPLIWIDLCLKLASENATAGRNNRRAAARYRALASIIPGSERSKETTICYKISLAQLITNLNVILYLSTCHTVYISVLILFMIMPKLIINTYVSLMYELKKKFKSIYE